MPSLAVNRVNNLSQFIYTSSAKPDITAADVERLLEVARVNNARLAVTGMLLFTSGTFFQVLEGDEATLSRLFNTISADPRHTQVTIIIKEPIAKRAFGDWSMGYAEMGTEDISALPGLNDFFASDHALDSVQQGRAKKLLMAFAHGRWRAKLAKDAGT